jgi:hypothetical protein
MHTIVFVGTAIAATVNLVFLEDPREGFHLASFVATDCRRLRYEA